MYRNLIQVSIINIFAFLTLVFKRSHNKEFERCSTLYIPCWANYSSFLVEQQLHFSLSYLANLFLGFFSLLARLVRFDKRAKRIEIYNDQRFKIAGKVFNAWDWRNNNE